MDNYNLVERLGQGSFAIVWKARRKSDNRIVAVKQLKQAPATWEECKRLPEIRAAALCRGPHIISLLEAVRHGSELFLVFEYADSDLYRCLGPAERRKFEESQVRWVMRQLFSGLAAVHLAGLVHCDVKPENLLLFARMGSCGETVLKLCDLGQATSAGEVDSYVGTRWYRSPELLLGVKGAGAEIDLWAAGCFMAELILLRPPFPGTDTRDMLFRICSALGAPEDGWSLCGRLTEASGLRFAPCAAEGPLWTELSSAGASSSCVELVRGVLRYDQAKRLPAARALQCRFFSSGAPEVAVAPPDKDFGRLRSAEVLIRSRDEAKAVSRKLQTTSSTRFMPSGPPSCGLGGLGLMGSILDEPVAGGLMGSSSTPSLPSCSKGAPSSSASQKAGYMGHGISSSSSSQVVGTDSPGFCRDRTSSDNTSSYGFDTFGFGNNSRRPPVANRLTDSQALLAPSMANRRAQIQQAQADAQIKRSQRQQAPPRDLTQGVALGAGLPPPLQTTQSSWQPSRANPSPGLNADRGPAQPPAASSSAMLGESPQRGNARLAARRGDDDEELANLFWSQVENSRA